MHGRGNYEHDLDEAGVANLSLGYALFVIGLVAFWPIPDPIGKIAEIWRFFRGD
jgi:hypothetical protein